MPNAQIVYRAAAVNACYRVSFCGIFPSLLPSGDERHTYTRLCGSLDQAEALFDEESSAYQIDRWQPEIRGWVLLRVRGRSYGA